MCVILICPKDIRPLIETLALCQRANPHGGGIAWRNNGAVEWLKTNSVAEMDRLAHQADGEIVIHFRVASVGGVCNALRHPFPVSRRAGLSARGQTRAVLFHNGTWGGYGQALRQAADEGYAIPGGRMSDTRAAAFLCSIYGRGFLKKCSPSRWVYFSTRGTARYGQWYRREGIYFSNLFWMPPAAPDGGTGHQSEAARELWDLRGTEDYWAHLNRVCPKPQQADKKDSYVSS